MTKDDILRMAREAGFYSTDANNNLDELQRFAALVAAKAAEDERAACASLCEEREDYRGEHACAILERGVP